jgi:hypothetical protein
MREGVVVVDWGKNRKLLEKKRKKVVRKEGKNGTEFFS